LEEKIPLNESVRSACEFLGIDPLYVANEGKLVAVVDPKDADMVIQVMRKNLYGSRAEIIGEVVADDPGKVIFETPFGSKRIVPMVTGELLPRIC
jgi:hydrogenase expression/formation protein HypE